MNNIISVLTPTHNRADSFLPQTILSVQNQREFGFVHEHIIVDNASTDRTEKVVKEFARKDKRIKYVKNRRNWGAGDALNVGYKRAKGDLIVPLDDDDMLPLSSLQIRYNFHKQSAKALWSYGRLLYIDVNNRLFDDLKEYNINYEPKHDLFFSLWHRCFIPNGTVTLRKEAVEKSGYWNPKLRTQDFDMWLKLASKKVKLYLIDSYLSLYRVHPDQMNKIDRSSGTYDLERAYYTQLYSKLLTKKSR